MTSRHSPVVLRSSLVLLSTIAVRIASLGQQSASAPKAQISSPDVVLTEQDNGKDIDLTIGGALIVKLPSNPSTGYNWTVVGEPSPLKLQKATFRKGKTKDNAVGASGTAHLSVQCEFVRHGNADPGVSPLMGIQRSAD